ncbi:helix-turn-helix domain-containing protein [Duganella sp. FT80W]|uniref:Helix-turn-helix domain-containing protein n=1 Tax=Duganella guangzhouensis TaxID=2666084 RepID=A0A6I2L0A8_9BURK|nr:helix-turn-helix transcriptional regulator [Duganella guangzhouensis]MRW91242.1 helix-turn-helix domain-containing protein [Duganella guangzhouensis]
MLTVVQSPRRCTVREGLGASAHLRQGRELFVPELYVGQSTVVLVLAGRKTVFGQGELWRCDEGGLILLPHGASYGVTNQLNGDAPYEAISLMFDDSLIAASAEAATAMGAGPSAASAASDESRAAPAVAAAPGMSGASAFAPLVAPRVLAAPAAGLRQAVERVRALWMEPHTPDQIARHAAQEVLVWLALQGSRFAPATQPSFLARLRALLAAAPAQPWNAASAAIALNVSEATLRRRLARDGHSMSGLLLEVRLSQAMMLLQATDDYVGQIALDCGFANHAHFSRMFKGRFGITPTQLRDPEHAVA